MTFKSLLCCAASVAAFPAFAQVAPAPNDDSAERDAQPEIVVTADRIAGSVDSDFPPDLVLDQGAIASYGASSVTDLLSAIAVQTQSTRSRGGGGFPVVLLNGRRISGFAEVRDLPPEAIKRVEVLTEDVAIRYGFSPGQRVVNFILQDNFSALSGEAEYGGPSAGGRSETEGTATYLRIAKKGRINLSAQYNRQTALEERERLLVPAGLDASGLRTLLPQVGTMQLNGTISRALSDNVTGTINLRYDDVRSDGVLGQPLALIANPTATPFALLERSNSNRAFRSGVTLDGNLGRWRWTVTGNYDRVNNLTETDRNFTNPALLSAVPRDQARSRLTTGAVIANINGPIARLPAGPAILAVRAGYDDLAFRSRATTITGPVSGIVNRSDVNGRTSLEVPILKQGDGIGRALGDFTINGNYAVADLSDFGTLQSHGYGFVWSPLQGLSFVASFTTAQAAPTPQQLGDPTISTPNVAVFDYGTGTTVATTLINGGNPLLRAEEQRDKSFTLSFSPPSLRSLSVSAAYTQKRSDDLLTSFPALTFDIERAFPVRVVRDTNGTLLSIDQRPINFAGSRDDVVRYGFQFSKEFGQRSPSPAAAAGLPGGGGPRGGGGGSGSGAGTGGSSGGGGGGFGRGGGFGMFGGGGGGRWSVSAYHSIRINDEIAIASGLPILDRLNGGATSFNGGTSRHVVDLEGGWFHKGAGFRLVGNWRSGSRVEGGTTAPDLFFSELMTINLRFFLNFDQRKNLIKSVPFLKGSRIAFRINNLTNAIQNVRDSNGQIPLRYQPGYIDPLGRTLEISFRKLF